MITKQIESTGHVLTIGQREKEARRHLVNTLARTEQQLWTLGEREAAEHCRAAIDAITNTPT